MTRRILVLAFAIVLVAALFHQSEAGLRLRKLARAALLGAAIAPRFVPIPIPHHVHEKHGWDHGHEKHGWDHGHGWEHAPAW